MSIRKISLAPGEFYHIYNRGNSKQVIFRDDEDRGRFLYLLFLANGSRRFSTRDIVEAKNIFEYDRGESFVSIGAYTLMPNHFHLLITQGENGSISKFMQKLSTAYSMYYNQKYKRTGALFEGKFKASHVSNDRYMRYLFSYIHLNAVKLIDPTWKKKGVKNKKAALQYIENYTWSSYVDYLNLKDRQYAAILDKKQFPPYFSSKEALQKEIFSWLMSHPEARPRGG